MTTSLPPGTSTSPNTPVIDTPSPNFTWIAGVSGAITALIAGAIAIGQGLGFDVLAAPTPVKVALIGLIGAGIIGWSIAAAGDTLARAYALAHVTRTEPGKENQPALQIAAHELAGVYAAAHGVPMLTNQPPAPLPAVLTKAATPQCPFCPFPTLFPVMVQGKEAHAIAMRVSGDAGKEKQEYLVGLPNAQPKWMDEAAVYMTDA